MLRPPPDTRSFATLVRLRALPPSVFAAISCSLLLRVGRRRVRRARHRMRRLAAARDAGPRQVLATCCPRSRRPSPRARRAFRRRRGARRTPIRCRGCRCPDCTYMRPSGLMTSRPSNPIDPAEEGARPPRRRRAPSMPVRCAAARLALLPVEQLGALVERFLEERAGRVVPRWPRAFGRAERRLALRRVDPANRHLVDAELPRRLRQHRLHQRVALHPARRALRAARRRVGQHRQTLRQRIASGW